MSEGSTREFDHAEFDRAMAVLEDEQRAMQLSPRQKLSLRLYSVFIGGFVVFLIATITYLSIKLGFSGTRDLSHHENIVLGLLVIGGGLCLVCAVVSLVLNIRVIVKIVRSRIRFRRMGFSDDSEALWKAHQKKRRWSAAIERIAVGLSVFFLLIMVLLVGYRQWGWALAMLFLAIVFLMFYILQNGKARLDMMSSRLADLAKLKASMVGIANRSGDAGRGRIALPDDVVQRFSRVETDQIARSRAQAITDSLRATRREYSILSSQQVRQAKSALAPGDRLKVEDTLDKLMQEPRPALAEKDASTGFLRLRVNGTGLELVYTADDSSMELRVASLQAPTVGRAPHA